MFIFSVSSQYQWRSALSSTILRTVYGIEIRDTDDPFVVNAQKVVGSLAEAGIPGAFLVDTLPFCMRS